jgi:hypothetical protein
MSTDRPGGLESIDSTRSDFAIHGFNVDSLIRLSRKIELLRLGPNLGPT